MSNNNGNLLVVTIYSRSLQWAGWIGNNFVAILTVQRTLTTVSGEP